LNADYVALWSCIPIAYRAANTNMSTDIPNELQLNNSLLNKVAQGEIVCTQSLLKAGANVNTYKIPRTGSFMDGPPLHLALSQTRYALEEILLTSGADPNLLTSHGGHSA